MSMNKNYENVKTLKTTYRRLENFLYLMGIKPLEIQKEWDGSTCWIYEDTPQLRLLAESFKDIETRLKQLNDCE